MNNSFPHVPLHIAQQGSGPKVVFIHGGEEAGGSVAFAAQLPLSHAHTLLLPDLPGYGQSPALGPKNVERDAQLIIELLADGAHLVGHSYGGAVALLAAARQPTAVHSLALIEPATLDMATEDPVVRQLLAEMAQAVALPDLRQRLEAFATVVGIHKSWPEPLSDTYRRLAEDLPALQPSSDAVPSRLLAQQVAAAGIPSLVISGGHRAALEHLCDALAGVLGAQRAVVPGYGHAPQQSGEPFNSTLEQFWSR